MKKILDKAKDLGKKGVDLAVKTGRKGVEIGKKGVEVTKEAVRKRTCSECKYYVPKDDKEGKCPIAGLRLPTSDAATCPQRAFEPK